MRPLSTSVPALEVIEDAPDDFTVEWVQRRSGLNNRQVLWALRVAVSRKLITRVDRGHYHRIKAA